MGRNVFLYISQPTSSTSQSTPLVDLLSLRKLVDKALLFRLSSSLRAFSLPSVLIWSRTHCCKMAPPQTSPISSLAGMTILPIEKGFSDGDKSTWPTDSRYGTIEPVVYLKKLAMQWIQSSGAQEMGKSCVDFLYPSLLYCYPLLFFFFYVLCLVGYPQVHFPFASWTAVFLRGA